MKIEDIDQFDQQEYKEICGNCNKIHKVYSQKDNNPEYYTTVNVLCDCNHLIEFYLPVN